MKKVVSSSSDFSAIREKAQSNDRLKFEEVSKHIEKEDEGVEETETPFELKGLEDLIFLGASTKDLKIGNFTFTLKTLSSKEQESIFKEALSFPEKERILFFKKASVAMSIQKINGKKTELYLKEGTFSEKMQLVETLQSSVFEMIFESLDELVLDSKKSLKVENLKK